MADEKVADAVRRLFADKLPNDIVLCEIMPRVGNDLYVQLSVMFVTDVPTTEQLEAYTKNPEDKGLPAYEWVQNVLRILRCIPGHEWIAEKAAYLFKYKLPHAVLVYSACGDEPEVLQDIIIAAMRNNATPAQMLYLTNEINRVESNHSLHRLSPVFVMILDQALIRNTNPNYVAEYILCPGGEKGLMRNTPRHKYIFEEFMEQCDSSVFANHRRMASKIWAMACACIPSLVPDRINPYDYYEYAFMLRCGIHWGFACVDDLLPETTDMPKIVRELQQVGLLTIHYGAKIVHVASPELALKLGKEYYSDYGVFCFEDQSDIGRAHAYFKTVEESERALVAIREFKKRCDDKTFDFFYGCCTWLNQQYTKELRKKKNE